MELNELFAHPDEAELTTPEGRMVAATLACIEEVGLQGVTVRAIVAKAGLNPAAVNYYFRSKDRLIETALRQAWTHAAEDFRRILEDLPSGEDIAPLVTRYLLEGAVRSPRVIHAIVVEHPTMRREAAAFFKEAIAEVAERSGVTSGGEVTAILLVGVIMLMGAAPDTLEAIAGIDLKVASAREGLAERLARRLFGPTAEGRRDLS